MLADGRSIVVRDGEVIALEPGESLPGFELFFESFTSVEYGGWAEGRLYTPSMSFSIYVQPSDDFPTAAQEAKAAQTPPLDTGQSYLFDALADAAANVLTSDETGLSSGRVGVSISGHRDDANGTTSASISINRQPS